MARQAELKGDGIAGKWMPPLSVHILPNLGSYPIEELVQHQILRVLKSIWHLKPSAAVKTFNSLNLSIKYAVDLGLDADMQAKQKAKALLVNNATP